jgi:hypothetical protein
MSTTIDPSPANQPRSWIRDSIQYAPGGAPAVAQTTRLTLERIQQIMAGAAADDNEVLALTRALRVPRTLLFLPRPTPTNPRFQRALLLSIAVLIVILGALAISLFFVARSLRPNEAQQTNLGTSSTVQSNRQHARPQMPALPSP